MTKDQENEHIEENELGEINISNEVIEIITNIAAKEIEGVYELNSNFTEDITGIFSKKPHTKGVYVKLIEEKVSIDLNIIVNFGVKIPEVAWKVQENIKSSVESMTGLEVEIINVNISGIYFTK